MKSKLENLLSKRCDTFSLNIDHKVEYFWSKFKAKVGKNVSHCRHKEEHLLTKS